MRVRPCFAAAFAVAASCTLVVVPPPLPDDPVEVFLLGEALHTGIVLPPDPTAAADVADADQFVEFAFGEWGWYALGDDAWYHVFGAVLWPTRGGLGRRTFGARTVAELRQRAPWLELAPIVVSAAKARALRARLQRMFDEYAGDAVSPPGWGFRFVPIESCYWLGNTCADAAADWLTELDCRVGWWFVRTGLCTVPGANNNLAARR